MLSLTIDFQVLYIKSIIENGFGLPYIPDIELSTFSSQNLKNIFLSMKMLYRNGNLISYQSLRQILLSKFKKADYINTSVYLANIKTLPKVDHSQLELLGKTLAEYVRLEQLKYAIAESTIHMEQGDLDKVESALMLGLSKGASESNGYLYFSHAEERYNRTLSKKTYTNDVLKTLIPGVDARLQHGGFLKSQLVLYAGRSGTGKSYTLTAMARNFVRQLKNGLYCNLEMSLDEQSERLDSAFLLRSPADLFKDVPATIKGLKKQQAHWGDSLYLIELPPMATNMLHIKQVIQTLRMKNFHPDFVIVDGADYLVPIKRTGESYWDMGLPYVELKRLGFEEDILVLADCQIHRKDAESDAFMEGTIGMEHTAHSFLRAMAASTFITINQTKDEYEKGLVRWSFAKQRGHGKRHSSIKLQMDTDRIYIHEPFDKVSGATRKVKKPAAPKKKKP
jgi:hypothetical protein